MSIPEEAISFIRQYVHSVEQLELLLLLRERHPSALSVDELNDVIRSSEASIRRRVATLCAHNLVALDEQTMRYSYAPATEALAREVEALAKLYRERRATLIELIYAQPKRALEEFSNAFVVKKDKEKGDG